MSIKIGTKLKKWTTEETNFLQENYKTMTHAQMGAILGRTRRAVQIRCSLFGFILIPSIPLEGRFGRFTIIKKSEKRTNNGNIYYWCRCDCGREIEVSGASLRSGRSNSCGCYKSDKAKEMHRLDPKENAYNKLEDTCKRGAKSRNIPYELVTEEFRSLIIQNCHWCGEEPRPRNPLYKKDGTRNKSNITISIDWANQQWVYVNGIDRIDNNSGYTIDNCVPCCPDCNQMKSNRQLDDFLNRIEMIYSRHCK